jgi:ABC-2 type transport system ATP-binding protein
VRPVDAIVQVDNLRKRYGDVEAVRGVSFAVRQGEIFGILGPNGAGKTTTLEIIEGLRTADSGTAVVAGIDVRRDPSGVKSLIGVQLQEAGFFDRLTVEETVDLFGAFHRRQLPTRHVLAMLDLVDRRRTLVETLSGGQRQRLSLALALINDPRVVFLDEPTTGLDPQARRHLWEIIERIRVDGRTIVLTTHYMEEAQRLCDRVAIMDHGQVIELGTPRALIAQHAGTTTVSVGMEGSDVDLRGLVGVETVDRANGDVLLHTRDPLGTLHALVEFRQAGRLAYRSLRLEEPTLEDVFLTLTGRRLRE